MSGPGPLRVCHLLGQLGSGGRETLLLDLVRASSADVSHSLCSLAGDDPIAAAFEEAGCPVLDLGAGSHRDVGALSRLYRNLRDRPVDVLHAHGPTSQVPARLLARPAGIPAVVSTHHIVRAEHDAWQNRLEALSRPLDTATVAVSESVRDSYGAPDWRVVRNGIDVDGFQASVAAASPTAIADPVPDADPVFLNVGRYIPQKAQADLVAAMPSVLDALPDAHLFLVGGRGSLGDDLRERAHKTGVADAVSVTGRVPSVHEYYARADVYVSASLNEGLPIVLLEAMAAGLPVVATDVPGNRDAVAAGETGLLVQQGDTDELAAAMRRTGDGATRRTLGARGRRRVRERYDVERTAGEYRSLYREVLGRPEPGRPEEIAGHGGERR